MTSLFQKTALQEAFAALKADLINDDGPRISTMRNYRFAIVPYLPSEELRLRGELQRLNNELVAGGWVVLTISLQRLVLERLRREGADWVERVVDREKSLDRPRALKYLRDKIVPMLEGDGGIAADCSRLITAFAEKNPDKAERTVCFIGRAGALFPFFRSSALLKHLVGKTANVPVVLLYPGERRGSGERQGLSFMGVVDPDGDYRPRIYP